MVSAIVTDGGVGYPYQGSFLRFVGGLGLQEIYLEARVTENSDFVKEVRIYDSGELIGRPLTNPPYVAQGEFNTGLHTIFVEVVDVFGNVYATDYRSIEILPFKPNRPNVEIVFPAEQRVVGDASNLRITVKATDTDSDHNLSLVQLLLNGSLVNDAKPLSNGLMHHADVDFAQIESGQHTCRQWSSMRMVITSCLKEWTLN